MNQEEPDGPFFASLDAFVEQYLLPNRRVKRSTANNTAPYWCPRWWLHGEAVGRFLALWQAWEVARLQAPPAMSLFWRDHADPHMAALTGENSPFRLCSPEQHKEMPVWPTEPAPDGLFDALVPLPQD